VGSGLFFAINRGDDMSQVTHRFHSYETLARAQEWLGELGFPSDHIEVCSTGLPTMTIHTEISRFPAVEMILNAADLTDPAGTPAYDELGDPRVSVYKVASEPATPTRTQTTPIGWHPTD
jgi:hypothetical protein